IFHAVMTAGNLTEAARLLHTSQPTVSRELARFEKVLGLTLFEPMVGKDLCVNIELDGDGKRHISGLVTAARVVGHEGRSVTYEL
ncbi:LysR family transcriptional regulator, partial [Salmonella enterica subsp. enterica serovar Kentucky]|nr:LysR family transcriptional regulator [Salmonella enterica subsp. enterica serovar Kentucky]